MSPLKSVVSRLHRIFLRRYPDPSFTRLWSNRPFPSPRLESSVRWTRVLPFWRPPIPSILSGTRTRQSSRTFNCLTPCCQDSTLSFWFSTHRLVAHFAIRSVLTSTLPPPPPGSYSTSAKSFCVTKSYQLVSWLSSIVTINLKFYTHTYFKSVEIIDIFSRNRNLQKYFFCHKYLFAFRSFLIKSLHSPADF